MMLTMLTFSPTFHAKMKIENRQIPLPHLKETFRDKTKLNTAVLYLMLKLTS